MSRVIKFRAWEDFNNKMYKCMVGNTDKMDDDWSPLGEREVKILDEEYNIIIVSKE